MNDDRPILPCRLIGCREMADAPHCARCGASIYFDQGGRWVDAEDSLLGPFYRFWWWLRALRPARCEQCGSILWRRDQRRDGFCSRECKEIWIPF